MKHIKKTARLGAGLVLATATSAAAQIGPDSLAPSDIQARATVTLPFGAQDKSVKHAPRLSLGLRSETQTALSDADWVRADRAEVREVNLGFALDGSSAVLINDQLLWAPDAFYADEPSPEPKPRGGLDTYDKSVLTVIAVSLTVIGGSILILAD